MQLTFTYSSTVLANKSSNTEVGNLYLPIKPKVLGPIIGLALLAGLVFFTAWFWLSLQLKELLNQRINITGHQYSKVAAIAASEAVVSGDLVYLEKLAKTLIAEPVVNRVSIYQIDGQIMLSEAVEPTENSDEMVPDWQQWLTSHLPQYSSEEVTFMPEILWNEQPVGWFEVTIDRHSLETDIRKSSYQITLVSISAFGVFFFVGCIWIIARRIRYYHKTKKASLNNQSKLETVKPEKLHDLATCLQQHEQVPQEIGFKRMSVKKELTAPESKTTRISGPVLLLYGLTPNGVQANLELAETIYSHWDKTVQELMTKLSLSATCFQDSLVLFSEHEHANRSQKLYALLKATYLLQIISDNIAESTGCRLRQKLLEKTQITVIKTPSNREFVTADVLASSYQALAKSKYNISWPVSALKNHSQWADSDIAIDSVEPFIESNSGTALFNQAEELVPFFTHVEKQNLQRIADEILRRIWRVN